MSRRGDFYLALPDPDRCGGLRWSAAGDAVEDAAGRTVAVAEELGLVLAGVLADPPVPPFADVLRLLHLARGDRPEFAPLREALRRTPAARHLGRLIAHLSRGGRPAPDPPGAAEVGDALRRRATGAAAAELFPLLPDRPADEFAAAAGGRLAALAPAALDHWLAFGVPPSDAGDRLAEQVGDLSRAAAGVPDVARARRRLAGLAVLAPAIDAALALPPRGRALDALPQGGYADVTTRGDPARLLPSQFALDPDEFVRRFAARELLYFRREEPHATTPPERVVVLDRGVRTWGGVRLALAAAAVSLLGRRRSAAPPPRLFVTGRGEVRTADPRELAGILEGSDLTPHPAEALAAALAAGGDRPRDVVLLTHRRAADDPAVQAAARHCRPVDRLFAVAVGDDGRAALSEWTPHGAAELRAFRVDLAGAEAARPIPKPRAGAGAKAAAGAAFDYRPWGGDVEPLPFPFRPGLIEPPQVFGFDAGGGRVVAVTASGHPHLLAADGGTAEVLPRAVFDGRPLAAVSAVLPVAGGVVLAGTAGGTPPARPGFAGTGFAYTVTSGAVPVSGATVPAGEAARPHHAAAHYDFAARTVRAFAVAPVTGEAVWESHPNLHCVVLRGGAVGCPLAVDLAHGNRNRPTEPTLRAEEAARRPPGSAAGPARLAVTVEPATAPAGGPTLLLRHNSFAVARPGTDPSPWVEPTEDGRPLLGGAVFRRAELAGDVLALHLIRRDRHELRLFRGPHAAALGVIPLAARGGRAFALSPDGGRVAWRHGRRGLAVADTAAPASVRGEVGFAAVHGRCAAAWYHTRPWLEVVAEGFRHEFRGEEGGVVHRHARADAGAVPPPPARRAVADRFGRVVLLDPDGAVLAALLVRRGAAAGWTPDGGFWGDPALIGGPPSPAAAAALSAALRRASEVR